MSAGDVACSRVIVTVCQRGPWRAALVLRSVRTRGDPLACARPRRDWRNEEVLEFGSMSEEEKTEEHIPGIFREVSGVYNA